MADPRHPHLDNAPIAEAVIEIKAAVARPVPDEAFDTLQGKLADRYPKHDAMRLARAGLSFKGDEVSAHPPVSQRLGVRLASSDGKDVVMATSASIIVSRLHPYQSWVTLVTEARRLWPIYCQLVQCTEVTRLGVRCINRIELPAQENIDLDSIFTAGPKVPPALSQTVEQYTTRVVLPYPDKGATLAIVQALDRPSTLPHEALLDIDAYAEVKMKPDDADLWRQLDVLHDLRNEGFFGSLQESVWETYK